MSEDASTYGTASLLVMDTVSLSLSCWQGRTVARVRDNTKRSVIGTGRSTDVFDYNIDGFTTMMVTDWPVSLAVVEKLDFGNVNTIGILNTKHQALFLTYNLKRFSSEMGKMINEGQMKNAKVWTLANMHCEETRTLSAIIRILYNTIRRNCKKNKQIEIINVDEIHNKNIEICLEDISFKKLKIPRESLLEMKNEYINVVGIFIENLEVYFIKTLLFTYISMNVLNHSDKELFEFIKTKLSIEEVEYLELKFLNIKNNNNELSKMIMFNDIFDKQRQVIDITILKRVEIILILLNILLRDDTRNILNRSCYISLTYTNNSHIKANYLDKLINLILIHFNNIYYIKNTNEYLISSHKI